VIDLVAVVISIVLIVTYHFFLGWRQRHDPLHTVHAVNIAARNAWVDMVMSSDKPDVLAVQTLRNSVMASSFMASTAILLLVGTLSISGSTDHSTSIWHALNPAGTVSEEIIAWKLVCLLLDFFIAFFCFSMAVRFYNHVGYMISIPTGRGPSPITPAFVIAYLNRAGLFYLLGTRSFFYSVPLVFWMFGPHLMVAATVGLIAALYPLDRAPRTTIKSAADTSVIKSAASR
jgi:uncharacterized membrane protein